jgi:hypothetical protein
MFMRGGVSWPRCCRALSLAVKERFWVRRLSYAFEALPIW